MARYVVLISEPGGLVEPVAIERMGKGYVSFCETPSVPRGLEQRIRHRPQATIRKQWKHSKVRYARLGRRNIGNDHAIILSFVSVFQSSVIARSRVVGMRLMVRG
jgi:hypothetical protein